MTAARTAAALRWKSDFARHLIAAYLSIPLNEGRARTVGDRPLYLQAPRQVYAKGLLESATQQLYPETKGRRHKPKGPKAQRPKGEVSTDVIIQE